MLKRCYSEKAQERNPMYAGCSVHHGWHKFSAFRAWMETQDWQGRELDKDLLISGNKIYSPESCVFVDSMTNTFIIDCGSARGAYPIGVYFDKHAKKFQAKCSNPFRKKQDYLGYFFCPNEAHLAWRKRKNELANQLADLQTDDRVANALRLRYA